MKQCHRCGCPWDSEKREPGVKECCPQCNAYLHCCLNCRFHDRSRPNQCQVPNTESIADRARANFCDEFSYRQSAPAVSGVPKEDAARKRLASLFGEESISQAPPSAAKLLGDEDAGRPSRFEDLFGE